MITMGLSVKTFEMSKEHFLKYSRSVLYKRYGQRTAQFSNKMQIGCDYYVYVDIESFEVINPFTKKHKNKKYKSFFSNISSWHVKELAYEWILKEAENYGFILKTSL